MAAIKTIEELFGTLQQSVVAEWRKHLKADNNDVHVILDDFYKEMPEKVDKLIEDYMGHTKKKVGDYKNVLDADEYDALAYLEELHTICDDGRALLDEVPELESDLDDVVGFIDTCMYKLRELTKVKECFKNTKSLTSFLYESLNECGNCGKNDPGCPSNGGSKDAGHTSDNPDEKDAAKTAEDLAKQEKDAKKGVKKGMKSLREFMEESLDEGKNPYEKWASASKGFNAEHLKAIAKDTKWYVSKLAKLLDEFDTTYGGPVEWSVKDGELIFKNVDAKKAWKCDGKKWEPTDFEDVK